VALRGGDFGIIVILIVMGLGYNNYLVGEADMYPGNGENIWI